MVKKYTANITQFIKSLLNNTASNSKMNGTQSAGSSELIARADHVHPSDTSRAPTNHKSTGTNYGVSDASNYGHAMASNTTPKANGTAAVGSETGKFARGDHVHPLPANASTSANGLMSSSDKTKLNGIATGANAYTHPTYTARTGKPTGNQTPAFGGTATVSQITSDATGHVTGATDRTIKIPDTSATSSTKGLVKLDDSPVESSSNVVSSGGVFTALEGKQNEAETQSKVVEFTNKDRVNISRLLNFMENGSGNNYYTLKLKGVYLPYQVQYSVLSDSNDRLAAENVDGMHLFCEVYKNNTKQTTTTQSITFKKLDGTVLGTSHTNSGASIAGQTIVANSIILPDITLEDGGDFGTGIHYVYAEATINGSVVRSQILSVFVKDTNNKLGYNSWSGTDYSNNTSEYNTGSVNCISSNEWSYNGESSLKAIGTFNQLFDVGRVTFDKNINVSSSIVIYNPDCPVRVYLRSYSSNLAFVDVPSNNNPQLINLSGDTVDDEWVTIRLMIKAENGGTFYLDSPYLN